VSLLARLTGGGEYRSGLAFPQDWLLDALGGPLSASGERITVEKALGVAPFNAGVRLISAAVGMSPLKVYRDVNGEKVPARDHRAWKMLHDMPNSLTPAGRFWETVTAHLLLYGDAFLLKTRSDGVLVDELWVLDPNRMTVEWDAAARRKRFVLQTPERRVAYTDEDVLHIPAWSLDGLKGRSAVLMCRDALGAAIARDQFEGSFYKRGAVLSLVLRHPGKLGEGGLKNLRESFGRTFGGASRSHGTPVLEEGMELERVQTSLRDMQFVESQRLTATTIATILNIPPSYIGGSTGDSLTYGTRESEAIQLVTHGIMPWSTRIEEALANDRGIFPFPSWRPQFVMEGLMRADARARGEFYKLLYEVDSILPNEIRALEDRPPIIGGDTTSSEKASQLVLGPPAPPAPSEEARSQAALEERRSRMEELRSLMEALRPEVNVDVQPPTIRNEITVEPAPAPNVTVEAPPPAEVRNEFTIEAAPAPSVTVEAPPPAEVHVSAPAVTVEPAQVTVEAPVTVEAAKAPTVFVEPPNVNVEVRSGRVRREIVRDPETGEITGSVETELEED
jgi:HK97 family phage portal protein